MRTRSPGRTLGNLIAAFAMLTVAEPATADFDVEMLIDSTGDGDGNLLLGPGAIAVDAGGNVFVVGFESDNVFQVAPGGLVTEIIDSDGDGLGNALEGPSSIALDAAGNVYVGGRHSDNVFKISAPLTCSTTGTPCAITEIIDSTGDGAGHALSGDIHLAVNTAGDVYVAAQSSDNLFKIAAPGACSTNSTPCVITEIMDSLGGSGVAADELADVAVDSSGHVYVVGWEAVLRVENPGMCSTSGTPCNVTAIMDANGAGPGSFFQFSNSVAVDSSGNVFVAAAFNEFLFRISTPGGCDVAGTPCTIELILDKAPLGPAIGSLAIDAADDIYFATGNGSQAFRVTSPSTCSTTGVPCNLTKLIDAFPYDCDSSIGLSGAAGIAVDSAGNVYTTGSSSDNAFEILPTRQDACTGGEFVQFEWSGVVPGPGVGSQQLPFVSPGESWTLTYTINSALPDSSPWESDVGTYIDTEINPVLTFSGGYSTPAFSYSGFSGGVDNSGSYSLITGASDSGELDLVAYLDPAVLSGEALPPDGVYASYGNLNWPRVFRLSNDDGSISYDDDQGAITVTVTRLQPPAVPAATYPVRAIAIIVLALAGVACGRR